MFVCLVFSEISVPLGVGGCREDWISIVYLLDQSYYHAVTRMESGDNSAVIHITISTLFSMLNNITTDDYYSFQEQQFSY